MDDERIVERLKMVAKIHIMIRFIFSVLMFDILALLAYYFYVRDGGPAGLMFVLTFFCLCASICFIPMAIRNGKLLYMLKRGQLDFKVEEVLTDVEEIYEKEREQFDYPGLDTIYLIRVSDLSGRDMHILKENDITPYDQIPQFSTLTESLVFDSLNSAKAARNVLKANDIQVSDIETISLCENSAG